MMIKPYFFKTTIATCPHCGFQNTVNLDTAESEFLPQIIVCDSEEGGCDRYFGVRVTFVPEVTVFELVSRLVKS